MLLSFLYEKSFFFLIYFTGMITNKTSIGGNFHYLSFLSAHILCFTLWLLLKMILLSRWKIEQEEVIKSNPLCMSDTLGPSKLSFLRLGRVSVFLPEFPGYESHCVSIGFSSDSPNRSPWIHPPLPTPTCAPARPLHDLQGNISKVKSDYVVLR